MKYGSTILLCLISIIGCQSGAKPNDLPSLKGDSERMSGQGEVAVVDTGQVYFKVMGTKDGRPLMGYEGDYPTATQQDTFFTIGLGASRDISVWSDMLAITIYTKHMVTGDFPVVGVLYAGDRKATMLLTSPKEGNVSQPKKGTVTITKCTDSLLSGKFTGSSITQDGSEMGISGVFLNVRYK